MPWPLKLLTEAEWDRRESCETSDRLEIGHCAYVCDFDTMSDADLDKLMGREYMARPRPRTTIAIVCPGRPGHVSIWYPEMQPSSSRDGHAWNISGMLPNVSISPSINFVGTYHGYVTGGMVTDDCEGRTFAPPLPRPQPPESTMEDPATTTEPAAAAPVPAAEAQPQDAAPETAAIEPNAPFAWAFQPPTPQRFVLYVLMPGIIRPAIVVAVNEQDVELAVLLTHKDHASCAAIIGASKVRQDQDGKAVGTWHWAQFQTSSVVTNVAELERRLDSALAQLAALGAHVAALTTAPVVPAPVSIPPGETFAQCITPEGGAAAPASAPPSAG